MKLLLPVLVIALGLVLGFRLSAEISQAATPPPPCCGQVNPDIYEVLPGYPSPALQTLNPLTQRIKAGQRVVRFRYLVMPGCSDGNLHDTLLASRVEVTRQTGITFIEDPNTYDFTVRANCGTSFTNICGSGAAACLGRGWPYNQDVDMSTIVATYYEQPQISIWWHEIDGHGLTTANEGYQLNGSFAATPGFVSFMNTGPDSRTGPPWPANDVNRWWRTMYQPLTVAPLCEPYGGCWNGIYWTWQIDNATWTWDPANHVGPAFDEYAGWYCHDGCPGR